MDAIRYAKLLSNSARVILIAKRGSPIDLNYGKQAPKEDVTFESINFTTTFSFSIIFGVRQLIEKHNIRNVIFFGASELRSLYFAFLAKEINLIVRHGTTKSRSKKDFFHRLVYSNVNWHIPICKHIASNVEQIIPFGKKTQMKVIYPSLRHLPDNIPTPEIRHKKTITLLHVARIADGKGHIDAIQACKVLHQQEINFKLVCVGEIDPNFANTLNRTLEKIPYRELIEFPGFSNEVSLFYQNADIFIFPSKGEGLSNSFIEALAYGLICIAYDNTSFPELQQAGFDFLLAKNGNIDDLKLCVQQSVKRLQDDKMPLIKNSQRAQELFGRNRELEELLGILT